MEETNNTEGETLVDAFDAEREINLRERIISMKDIQYIWQIEASTTNKEHHDKIYRLIFYLGTEYGIYQWIRSNGEYYADLCDILLKQDSIPPESRLSWYYSLFQCQKGDMAGTYFSSIKFEKGYLKSYVGKADTYINTFTKQEIRRDPLIIDDMKKWDWAIFKEFLSCYHGHETNKILIWIRLWPIVNLL